jgi:S1-C subfamily serine protease
MKRLGAILGVVLCAAVAGRARAAESNKPTLSVARITSSIQEGQKWGRAGRYVGCSTDAVDLKWGVGLGRLNVRALEQPAREELKKQGFSVAGDATDPFATEERADVAIGGTITTLNSEFCYNSVLFGNINGILGFTSIGIDWQIYSTIERRVIAKIHIDSEYRTKKQITGDFEAIMINAVDDSVRKLTESAAFREAIDKRPTTTGTATLSPASVLSLAGAKAAQPMKIADAVGSVVLVLSGGGHGSGFLVSSDGMLVTAEHVVGSDKFVKIRWSDGLEAVGEVVRTDKRRDVALIKTDPRGRQPLALRREAPQPGDTVFAIGAPIDPKLQSTVTRGVISANRILDGFSFIQSDVMVDPGNSGGPLLDEQGRVLGFTDKGLRSAEAPTGLNFFVPIDDALRFLSAEPQ